ncbi:Eukaryotic aspartyl protease [Aphelenchoides besseyi]|nr:Eukaryotic aspartyl protease [Aphelenchoides besseyi]
MSSSLSALLIVCVALFHSKNEAKTIPQPFYNTANFWFGPFVIGTPSQFMMLRIDTEVPDFFFVSKYCKTNGCTKNRFGFDNKKSKTFHEFLHLPYSVTYMGAKQKGRLMIESLTGLGKPIPLYFPLVDQLQGDFILAGGDGVGGLGFPRGVSLLPNLPLVTKLIGEQVYTFHVDSFNHTTSSGLQNSGFGVYGGNDDQNCKSDIVWHPIAVQKRWILKLDKVAFGGKHYAGANALIKPGPFKIYGPKSDIDAILKTLNAKQENGEYVVDCNGRSAFPNFEFTVQGITHKLSPTQYTVQSLDDKSKCIALFQEVDKKLGDQPWILGDPLFHKSCVSLHIGKSKIGFAALK